MRTLLSIPGPKLVLAPVSIQYQSTPTLTPLRTAVISGDPSVTISLDCISSVYRPSDTPVRELLIRLATPLSIAAIFHVIAAIVAMCGASLVWVVNKDLCQLVRSNLRVATVLSVYILSPGGFGRGFAMLCSHTTSTFPSLLCISCFFNLAYMLAYFSRACCM